MLHHAGNSCMFKSRTGIDVWQTFIVLKVYEQEITLQIQGSVCVASNPMGLYLREEYFLLLT